MADFKAPRAFRLNNLNRLHAGLAGALGRNGRDYFLTIETSSLATGVPKERCERINVGYIDPGSIDLQEWAGREDEGILLVSRAGEMLYRVLKPIAGEASNNIKRALESGGE